MTFVRLDRSTAREAHTLRRLFQRHGMAITSTEYRAMCLAIETGAAHRVGPARAGGIIYRVTLRGKPVFVVWSNTARCICTVLPGVPEEARA